jgi:hypothetical protein
VHPSDQHRKPHCGLTNRAHTQTEIVCTYLCPLLGAVFGLGCHQLRWPRVTPVRKLQDDRKLRAPDAPKQPFPRTAEASKAAVVAEVEARNLSQAARPCLLHCLPGSAYTTFATH